MLDTCRRSDVIPTFRITPFPLTLPMARTKQTQRKTPRDYVPVYQPPRTTSEEESEDATFDPTSTLASARKKAQPLTRNAGKKYEVEIDAARMAMVENIEYTDEYLEAKHNALQKLDAHRIRVAKRFKAKAEALGIVAAPGKQTWMDQELGGMLSQSRAWRQFDYRYRCNECFLFFDELYDLEGHQASHQQGSESSEDDEDETGKTM